MSGLLFGLVLTATMLLLPAPYLPVQDARAPRAAEADEQDRALLTRLRVPLSGLALVGGWTIVGGTVGWAIGLIAAVLGWRVLSEVEAPGAARRRRELERDLPVAVHLLGAALVAGSTTAKALWDVADALPGPVAEEFRVLHHRLALGVDPVSVWRSVDGVLQTLGRSMARAHESGGSVVADVHQLATELSGRTRLRRDALARTVEVRAAAPLGLCFLPAFVLIGVVPMVVGIFSSVRLFT